VKNRKIYLEIENQEMQINGTMSQILYTKGYLNEKVTIGIRPEDIEFVADTKQQESDESRLTVCPSMRELLGSEANIYFELGNKTYCTFVPVSKQIKLNEPIQIRLDQNKIHLFDNNTEENILFIEDGVQFRPNFCG
jgi:multiple sugar transport system ATP-binding protein